VDKRDGGPRGRAVSIFGAAGEESVLRQYQGLGIDRAVFLIPPEGREKVLPLLDQYAALIRKFA